MKVALSKPISSSLTASRLADYAELCKPNISLMILLTVSAGAFLASGGAIELAPLLETLFGTVLVAGGASALNQFLERDTDAKMARTASRPLPAGRLSPREVLLFGLTAGVVGSVGLALCVNPLTGLIASISFATYVLLYTPLKRRTTLNTLVGAVPVALPPLIGWASAHGTLSVEAWGLFAIVFVWQFPHFFAIAWLYRDQYEAAGLKMLPLLDREQGGLTSRQALGYALALVPVSLWPCLTGMVGARYFVATGLLGIAFVVVAAGFAWWRSEAWARRLVRYSLIYLPMVFLFLMLDSRG